MDITRRSALAGFGAVAATFALPARATSVTQPSAVLELFTSQGCSSCPAADAVLASYADRDDVLALAWHVDYWDYLGWRDDMARPAHSARQRAYAENLGDGVYTPQVIVNGVLHGVGHRRDEVAGLLETARRAQPLVPLAIARHAAGYHVSLAGDEAERARAEDATLFLVRFDSHRSVPIGRGENAGRRIDYRNIVRGMQMLGSVANGRMEVSLSLAALRRAMPERHAVPVGQSCALVLQHSVRGMPGPIVGAATLGDLSGA